MLRSNTLKVLSLKTNEVTQHMKGMVMSIQELAADYPTGNLYWADHQHRWIMVAEQSFNFFAKVYKNESEQLRGLAIHSMER